MAYESRIPQIVAEISSGVAKTVQAAGFKIEAGAKRRARVKTGYMRGQIRWMPAGEFSGEVVGGAYYTIFNEFGTVHMGAQPMFVPATEEVRPWFMGQLRLVIKEAVK